MNLCVDIGNSKTKLGIYDPNRKKKDEWLVFKSRKKFSLNAMEEVLLEFDIQAAIVSNTRAYDPQLKARLQKLDHFMELDYKTRLPIKNHYATPETLGKDRLAAVCGADYLFPDKNVLVIDAGTCITVDMIDCKGEYYGGSIHPGITIRFKSLNNYTGNLPLIKRRKEINLAGDSTAEAIASGVQYGVLKEIEGMIADYRVKKGELKVIITGGDASFFVSRLKSKIFAHSNLVLTGLSKILDYNVEEL